ncbi:small GTP-binding protein [Xanthomonas sacchari]|nr:small GTP-binding protein [Xanthomonas sacchari]
MISMSRKISLLGNFAVGKTSLVARAVRNTFSDHYLTTVGVKVDSKTLLRSSEHELRLVLWDIAGASLIDQLRGHYLSGSHGLLLVADGTRAHTLATVLELREQAERTVGRSLPAVLVLNKCDMADQWDVTPAHVRHLAQQLPTFSASARSGDGVEEAFAALAAQLEHSP